MLLLTISSIDLIKRKAKRDRGDTQSRGRCTIAKVIPGSLFPTHRRPTFENPHDPSGLSAEISIGQAGNTMSAKKINPGKR